MKKFNAIREAASRGYLRAGAAVGLGLASVGAFAQSTDPFQDVLDNVTTKVETYAGSLVVLAGVAVVFMVGIKYIKKLRGAA